MNKIELSFKEKNVWFLITGKDWTERIIDDYEFRELVEKHSWKDFFIQDKKGSKKIEEHTIDINNNYIFHWENLIIMNKILPIYKGKIKLIYIDPPYNTGNKGFNYKDTFEKWLWLTFMKNRLEIAKELLSDDGSIYVNIDSNESHYLKVLMDEIFWRENFQREIIWRMGFVSWFKTVAKNYIRNHDTILFYSKNPKKIFFNKQYIQNSDFKNIIPYSKEYQKIFEKYGVDLDTFKKIADDINYENRWKRYPLEDTWNCNKWDDLNSIAIESSTKRLEETVVLDNANFKWQKPEKLLQRIISSSSEENDIVMDFFLWSWTTCAVAHKMWRKYIWIEQMDYIEDGAIKRLLNVIKWEKSWISKNINWNGWGNFYSCSLKNNEW